jgi:hypothetical protein
MYDKLPEPTDEENDMLDLAFGLTETYPILITLLIPSGPDLGARLSCAKRLMVLRWKYLPPLETWLWMGINQSHINVKDPNIFLYF